MLVRAGEAEKSDRMLEKIWAMCGINKKIPSNKVEAKTKYTEAELEKKSFAELRDIGYKFGTKGRSSKELIKEILELQ